MPKLLEECMEGVSETKEVISPWAVCISTLRKAGLIKKGKDRRWVYTAKGRARHKEKYGGLKAALGNPGVHKIPPAISTADFDTQLKKATKLHIRSYGLSLKSGLNKLLEAKWILDNIGYPKTHELYRENERLISNYKHLLGITDNPGKEPWKMTKDKWREHYIATHMVTKEKGRRLADEIHIEDLEQAVAEGRSISDEVLRDYPNLKQLWQMTREEFQKSGVLLQGKYVLAWEDLPEAQKERAKSIYQKETGDTDEAEKGWTQFSYDVKTQKVVTDDKITHRWAIKQALSQGKPIPPKVLKDYPELRGHRIP